MDDKIKLVVVTMYAQDEGELTGLIGETTIIEYPVDSLTPACTNSSLNPPGFTGDSNL